jgi:hypothetical protein
MPRLETHQLHLGLGATAVALPPFNRDMAWYEAYGAAHAADGVEGRLVSMHRFNESWTSWELHSLGAEVVICTSGQFTLIQEQSDGNILATTLSEGEYAINAAGVWHTADVTGSATALFITAGAGTQHRPR